MCIPCGPKWRGPAGRPSFTTSNEIIRSISLESAAEKYPDNDAAIELIKSFIKKNTSHTEKWMINRLSQIDICLARIMVESYNMKAIRKYIRSEKN